MLTCCTYTKQLKDALMVLDVMRALNIEPDIITYNILMKLFFSLGAVSNAENLLAVAKTEGKLISMNTVFPLAQNYVVNGDNNKLENLLVEYNDLYLYPKKS